MANELTLAQLQKINSSFTAADLANINRSENLKGTLTWFIGANGVVASGTAGAGSFFNGSTKDAGRITLDPGLSNDLRLSVFVHELGHALWNSTNVKELAGLKGQAYTQACLLREGQAGYFSYLVAKDVQAAGGNIMTFGPGGQYATNGNDWTTQFSIMEAGNQTFNQMITLYSSELSRASTGDDYVRNCKAPSAPAGIDTMSMDEFAATIRVLTGSPAWTEAFLSTQITMDAMIRSSLQSYGFSFNSVTGDVFVANAGGGGLPRYNSYLTSTPPIDSSDYLTLNTATGFDSVEAASTRLIQAMSGFSAQADTGGLVARSSTTSNSFLVFDSV
ncbi:hypothetical protein [Roseateles terrae]|uniref:Uncharacterized protein n=1 Tax=Roseateles terrae TaxID=431060 RepID=A0ABR6GL80_9BURK|nr:hypothetical protein [Roseateles terrae]MBB3192846.1 hypothetical protein [Roseateles terrae]